MNNTEYLVFGFTIEKLCLLYGVILVMFGIAISYASSSASLTSYIPSFLGFPLIISSYLSIIDLNRKKLYAHISVFIILIAFLGGLDDRCRHLVRVGIRRGSTILKSAFPAIFDCADRDAD